MEEEAIILSVESCFRRAIDAAKNGNIARAISLAEAGVCELEDLQDIQAAQLGVERTAETESEEEVNPYLLSGAELARAEAAARSR